MKTVKEVFSKAFGDVPEGATCHVKLRECASLEPCFQVVTKGHKATLNETFQVDHHQRWYVSQYSVIGPDISNRDAEAFRGFFGAEYDAALDQLQGEK
jgi:hypothetical protein